MRLRMHVVSLELLLTSLSKGDGKIGEGTRRFISSCGDLTGHRLVDNGVSSLLASAPTKEGSLGATRFQNPRMPQLNRCPCEKDSLELKEGEITKPPHLYQCCATPQPTAPSLPRYLLNKPPHSTTTLIAKPPPPPPHSSSSDGGINLSSRS
ncbi:hypothetical protein NL676_028475 [Syzygium grande]|nr:hypothetical protein NL676_028475 [Syzygium grande]